MDIRPTPVIASLAGTARAQAQGSDAGQAAASGGVSHSPQLHESTDIEAGSKSGDRDADGRQLLQRDGNHDRDEPTPGGDDAEDRTRAAGPHPSPTTDGPGTHIDFDA